MGVWHCAPPCPMAWQTSDWSPIYQNNLSVFFHEQSTGQISSAVSQRSAPSQPLLAVDVWPVETGMPTISMHAGTTHRGRTAPPAPLLTPSFSAAVPASSPALQGGTRTKVGCLGGLAPPRRCPARRSAAVPAGLADPRQGSPPPRRLAAGGRSHPSRETVGRHLLDQRVRNATAGTARRSSSGAHFTHCALPPCFYGG